jgi:hypothetical protein
MRCIVGIRAMHKGIALQHIQNTRLERQRKVVWLISLYNHLKIIIQHTLPLLFHVPALQLIVLYTSY